MTCDIIEENGKAVLIKVNPEDGIMDNESSLEFKKLLDECLVEGKNKIELDLMDVKIMNSSAIGKILFFYKKLKKENGFLMISRVSEELKETFQVLKLDELFELPKH